MRTQQRLPEDIEISFREASKTLDTLLEQAKAALHRRNIFVNDRSNRDGFDKSGFPIYVWHYAFERKEAFPPNIFSARVHISYTEPVLRGKATKIEIEWIAEIFQQGKISGYEKRGEERILLDDLAKKGLENVVDYFLEQCRTSLEDEKPYKAIKRKETDNHGE